MGEGKDIIETLWKEERQGKDKSLRGEQIKEENADLVQRNIMDCVNCKGTERII